MAGYTTKFEIIDRRHHNHHHHRFPFSSSDDDFFHHTAAALDLISPIPSLLDLASSHYLIDFPSLFPATKDLVYQIETTTTPFHSKYTHLLRRVESSTEQQLYLRGLSDRVSDLEAKFERLLESKAKEKKGKYKWTAEIEHDGKERKYRWTAEIETGRKEKERKGKKEKDGGEERSYKWTAEIKGKEGEEGERKYTWTVADGGGERKLKKGEKKKSVARVVEIEEGFGDGGLILRKAFAKRADASIRKGKKKEFSPQDAALMIQINFRDYLIRRSRALRGLRELAIAKTKLKEIRALFHNFSYCTRVARDAEERQKFTEKIIVLLLTVDAIEGADLMVRSAKKSMVDELEAMLDVVDPHPTGRSLSIRRRTFDLPSGGIQKELAEGVASVVQLLDESESC
ncbi:BAG family molecular chaperone regulator 7-like protein [Drosera capensis]